MPIIQGKLDACDKEILYRMHTTETGQGLNLVLELFDKSCNKWITVTNTVLLNKFISTKKPKDIGFDIYNTRKNDSRI